MAIGPILPLHNKVGKLGICGNAVTEINPPSEEKRFKGFDNVLGTTKPDVQQPKHIFTIPEEEKEGYNVTHIPSRDDLIRKKENAKRIMKLANDEEFQAQQAREAKRRMEEEMDK
jgi:hypothetical protein